MRPLAKLEEPQVLRDNGTTWTADYVGAVGRGERPRGHWGAEEIRDQLTHETERKCAYCESYVAHVTYEHVEHIRPKSRFPELAHTWENLTAACPRCNTKKGTYHVPGAELINPYDDAPNDHLLFLANLVVHRAGSLRGELTVNRLGLRDLDLVNARLRRLEAVFATYLRWHDAVDPLKESLAMGIREDAQAGEYTASVESFLVGLGFPL